MLLGKNRDLYVSRLVLLTLINWLNDASLWSTVNFCSEQSFEKNSRKMCKMPKKEWDLSMTESYF